MSTETILEKINQEDQKVAFAIQKVLPAITELVDGIYEKMKRGGRLFYIGSGTSGRLGIVDASECPPTFGVPSDWVIGIISGGDEAIRNSVEHAEDDINQAWKDLKKYDISSDDVVVGITASGTTPYVVHGLAACQQANILTGSISCNSDAAVSENAFFPVEVIAGPEFVTGSTRMKAGTAQKLVLNMITTSVMIKLGRVLDNKMVDMQLSNNKLVDRGTFLVMDTLGLSYAKAKALLLEHGSVRSALDSVE